ncbi:diguanylate cyclase domain-containing protein [Streptomyces sp. NPDC001212]|uniref:GGDEF domain-containing protein n=1 Tax=Streptomyces sp. HYC2 TaxID=2955207 RepID=UPI0024802538|nr:sensor domain-containing diguanylate cyclase [Streptomyces sp. HYC2]
MTHEQSEPGMEMLETLIAELGEPRPSFTDDELTSGFHKVMEQLGEHGSEQSSESDFSAEKAEIGSAAYALGLEFSQRADCERAAYWFRLASRHGVPDAAYELHAIEQRRASAHTTDSPDTAAGAWEASAARLARLRQACERLHEAKSLAHTLKAVTDGLVNDLDYGVSCLNLVRPDGDLAVIAVTGNDTAETFMVGRVGPRAAWDVRLSMGERWGDVVYVSHEIGWTTDGDGVPSWHTEGTGWAPGRWHAADRLFAEMRTADGDLLGVLSVDDPRDGMLPGPWELEALQLYAAQAALAITNARLRTEAKRVLARSGREQTRLQVNEDRLFRTVTLSPRPMALAAVPPGHGSKLLKVNDALCRLLDRSPDALREFSMEDLVHPDDLADWFRISWANASSTVRLTRRDGTYVTTTISISTASVTDHSQSADGPRYLITVEQCSNDRSSRAADVTCDPLTGALTGEVLRSELHRLCNTSSPRERVTSLAVLSVGLDDFTQVNTEFGQDVGDEVLIEVVQRLTKLSHPGDLLARTGGDEFSLLVVGRSFQQLDELITRIHTALSHPIRAGSATLRLTACIGRGWARHGMTPEQVLNSADQDMFFIKTLRKTAQLSRTS